MTTSNGGGVADESVKPSRLVSHQLGSIMPVIHKN